MGPNIVNLSFDDIQKILRNGFIIVFLANENIIAHVQVIINSTHDWSFFGVAVHPHHQRNRLGEQLVRSVVKLAGKHTVIHAKAREDNLSSLAIFVNKNGFIGTDFKKNYLGVGKDRLLMEWGPVVRNYSFKGDVVKVSCNDKQLIRSLFEDGYKLIKIDKSLIRNSYLIFRKLDL